MDKIDYELLVQDALKGVVKSVLKAVAHTGMPSGHHFLITFLTSYVGVVCPKHFLKEHEDEMTIILQHEYFNLVAEERYFRVSLSFNNHMENLVIPYDAIICFVDPYVKFGLHFDTAETDIPLAPDDSDTQKDNVISLDTFRHKKTESPSFEDC